MTHPALPSPDDLVVIGPRYWGVREILPTHIELEELDRVAPARIVAVTPEEWLGYAVLEHEPSSPALADDGRIWRLPFGRLYTYGASGAWAKPPAQPWIRAGRLERVRMALGRLARRRRP